MFPGEIKEVPVNEWELPPGRHATRTAVRFPLQLAVRIETEEGPVDAVTRDISSNGILFVTDRVPRVGSTIEFTLTMPAGVMGWENDVTIHCFGRVVRHQMNGDESMAAAMIDQYFLKG
jgi:hypothetical protein